MKTQTIECPSCGEKKYKKKFIGEVIDKKYFPLSMAEMPPALREVYVQIVSDLRHWDCTTCDSLILNPDKNNEG